MPRFLDVSVPLFTAAELKTAISDLKRGRASDAIGITAEMLKDGSEELSDALLLLYNKVICPDGDTPESWKNTVISVIPKAGDLTVPQNYRPICSIPMLYKLFSRLLYNRHQPVLDQRQPHDQAGFRPGHSTTDHLFTFHMVRERAREWNQPVWVAALDFKKAFDSIEHDSLWSALREQGVEPGYVHLMQRLYHDQEATVRTDVTSRSFSLRRGTKQGDPLSSLLFNAVLQHIMAPLIQKWQKKRMGIQLGATNISTLTNLRFADDVLLTAQTLPHLHGMLIDVVQAARPHGLELHPAKTKIMSNVTRRTGRAKASKLEVCGMGVDILPHAGSIKYLGQTISFNDATQTEVQNRIKAAWATFTKHKQELTSTHYPLQHRLRLFNGVVTPTILCASATWTVTTAIRQQLRSTQRRMLRMIVNTPRKKATGRRTSCNVTSVNDAPCSPADTTAHVPTSCATSASHDSDLDSNLPTPADPLSRDTSADDDADDDNYSNNSNEESWVEYIRRATRRAEDLVHRHGIQCWITTQRQSMWKYALRVVNHPPLRWTLLALRWHPGANAPRQGHRNHGGQHKRWDDDLRTFLHAHRPDALPQKDGAGRRKGHADDLAWTTYAADNPDKWHSLMTEFCKI